MELVGAIYEAALFGDRWADVMGNIARSVDARFGGMFLMRPDDFSIVHISDEWSKGAFAACMGQGLGKYNIRVPRLLAMQHQGFVTDQDLQSEVEIAANPMYSEFLVPKGIGHATATRIDGVDHGGLICTVEGFASQGHARQAIGALDVLRPHIQRAMDLSAKLRLERAASMTAVLAALDVPAAILNRFGRVLATNQPFDVAADQAIRVQHGMIRFADRNLDVRLQEALVAVAFGQSRRAEAIAMPLHGEHPATILHLVPVACDARDLMLDATVLAYVSSPKNRNAIASSLLCQLFGLTPAEARVAAALAEGATVAEIASSEHVSINTVRTQTRIALSKTDCKTQRHLALLLRDLNGF